MNKQLEGYPGQSFGLMAGELTLWSKILISEKNFVAQVNDWSCGAAVFLMTQKVLQDCNSGYEEAVRLTSANSESGTANDSLLKAFRTLQKDCEIKSGCGANLGTLKALLKEGYLVIVNFREPENAEGHYAVLQGISDFALQLADPWYGRESVLSLEDFDFRSGFAFPVLEGWYVAARRMSFLTT